jgi:guanosine-3',5'-bis(diphosphate) 3'-pyrophosphohydrolase
MKYREAVSSISDIVERFRVGGNGDEAVELVSRAYEIAELAHEGQVRESGEPYILHPLAVSSLLADLGMEPEVAAAGLLHDVIEDTEIQLEYLEQEFGTQVAALVDGVTKLDQIEQEQTQRFQKSGAEHRNEQESESLRKMFMAMGDDIRVVIVKLADRLHNMRTLGPLPERRRRAFARETLDIYAPLANRLGVWQWKWELEDLSLRHLNPEIYEEIAAFLEDRRAERERSIERHIQILQGRLDEEGIDAEITGRPKHIYSIYRKMQRKTVPFSQVYDVRGIRVITNTVPDCYRILGIVHGLWNPIPGEFDDYIATPKDNVYQSLHTAVVGEDGKTLEVQIRTRHMHRTAEYGIAAHWRYKEGGKRDLAFEARIAWLRSQMEWRQEVLDAGEFVNAMKTDVFQDRVYTFTPKGKLIDLPSGATPVDFAYYVHTEIGHRCRGARVNDRWVALDYQLRTGDQVEIITDKRAAPRRDWLNPALGYVQTTRARAKIRQWFRHRDREKNISQGREMVDKVLKRLGTDGVSHLEVAKRLGHEKLCDFHAAVGFGDINSQQIASRVSEMQAQAEEELPSIPSGISLDSQAVEGIQVRGTGGLLTRLSRCCNPLPGDDIVGYVTRGRGVSIHRRECPNMLRLDDTDRLIEVDWGVQPRTVPVPIRIRAFDRTGLLNEISGIVTAEDINIAALKQHRSGDVSTFSVTLEIHTITQLDRVLSKIERIPNVVEARRVLG